MEAGTVGRLCATLLFPDIFHTTAPFYIHEYTQRDNGYNDITAYMKSTKNLSEEKLVHAWQELQNHADSGNPLTPEAYRLAFADPEFLLRRETRSIRFQLEMLKPELEMDRHGIDHTVVVFGSARLRSEEESAKILERARQEGDTQAVQKAEKLVENARYYEAARRFSRLVAEENRGLPRDKHMYICTGGGPGIMEAANRGAHEAGEPNVGLNISLPFEQSGNRYITPHLSFKFHYFALRKMHFTIRAKAIVIFPGGFGTMDELFEALTLIQTHKAHPVPVVLYNEAYWKRLFNLNVLVEEGTISPEDLMLISYVETPEAAWRTIQRFYGLESG